jgi:hypothetical protein
VRHLIQLSFFVLSFLIMCYMLIVLIFYHFATVHEMRFCLNCSAAADCHLNVCSVDASIREAHKIWSMTVGLVGGG